jgi:hypothetical protein
LPTAALACFPCVLTKAPTFATPCTCHCIGGVTTWNQTYMASHCLQISSLHHGASQRRLAALEVQKHVSSTVECRDETMHTFFETDMNFVRSDAELSWACAAAKMSSGTSGADPSAPDVRTSAGGGRVPDWAGLSLKRLPNFLDSEAQQAHIINRARKLGNNTCESLQAAHVCNQHYVTDRREQGMDSARTGMEAYERAC